MSFIPLLQDAANNAAANPLAQYSSILMFVPLIAIFYFFIIRPQNKKQKEAEKMRSSVQKGDKIITIGGIHGTVSSVKEKTIVLKVEDGAKIEFERSAISSVISDRNAKVEKKEEKVEKVEEKAEEKIEENSETTENK